MKRKFLFSPVVLWLSLFVFSCEDHTAHDDHADTTAAGPHAAHGTNHAKADHSDMLHLTAREQLLAGIRVDTVRQMDFRASVTVLGETAIDENTINVVSARTSGRIERLYLSNPGEDVRKGQALYDLYSEVLRAEEEDLLQLIRSSQPEHLVNAARQKLKLHGVTDRQLAEIEKRNSASPVLTVYSATEGFLADLRVREGQYVQTGDVLFEIASLDVVLVNAQVYPGEITNFNQAAVYEVESGNSIFPATLVSGLPALEPNSKILYVRLRVNNPGHVLRPGMITTVTAGNKTERVLAVPATALLEESGMRFTWIMEKDGMFTRRMVRTGRVNRNVVEIMEGLEAGDRVIVAGTYLLNSEYILRKGANPMGGMEM